MTEEIGSGENVVRVKPYEGASRALRGVVLAVGDEVVHLSRRDARDLAAAINRIARAPRRVQKEQR